MANEFLRKQLQDFELEIAETESKLQAFKESNTDALPGSYQTSIEQLNLLKRQEAEIATIQALADRNAEKYGIDIKLKKD